MKKIIIKVSMLVVVITTLTTCKPQPKKIKVNYHQENKLQENVKV